MSIVSASAINVGSLVKDGRGGSAYYVQKITYDRDVDGRNIVTSFVALPVVNEDFAPSGSQIVPLPVERIKDRDRSVALPANPHVAVGDIASRIIEVDPDHYMVNLIGHSDTGIVEDVQKIFEEMGAHHGRTSDLPRSHGRTMNWDNYTGGGVVGEQPSEQEHVKKTRKKRAPKPKAVDSLVKVPDIYLEDAFKHGFIDKETYITLTHDRAEKEIITLREALALTQKDDAAGLRDYVEGLNFDDIFPESKRNSLDDVIVAAHPVVQAAIDVDLFDAVDNKLLTNKFTAEALTMQFVDGDPESAEKVILDLEEAFRLVALDPDYLADYKTPGSKKKIRHLSEQQQQHIIDDIKRAFNVLSKEHVMRELPAKISAGYSRFLSEYTSLMADGTAFTRHDPAVEVVKEIRPQNMLASDTTRVKNNRPERLNLG